METFKQCNPHIFSVNDYITNIVIEKLHEFYSMVAMAVYPIKSRNVMLFPLSIVHRREELGMIFTRLFFQYCI